MELNEIIKEALNLPKKDKTKLINELLASMSNKDGKTMPVYRALEVFGERYKRFKGTEYRLGKVVGVLRYKLFILTFEKRIKF